MLRSWGADISETDVQMERNEPDGTVTVRGGFEGGVRDEDRTLRGSLIPSLIDELPLLAVVGTRIEGGIQIRDASELRFKESDRLATTAKNLRAMGAEVEDFPDGLRVSGPTKLTRRDDRLVRRSPHRDGFLGCRPDRRRRHRNPRL